jgi:hypothetical protein
LLLLNVENEKVTSADGFNGIPVFVTTGQLFQELK